MIVAFILHDGPAAALPAAVFAANAGVAAKRSKATVHSVFRDMVDLLVLGVGASPGVGSPELTEVRRARAPIARAFPSANDAPAANPLLRPPVAQPLDHSATLPR